MASKRQILTLAVVVLLLLSGIGAWLMWRTLHRVAARIDNREPHVINRRTGIFRSADQSLEGRARQYAEQQIRTEAVHKNILGIAQEGGEAKLAPLLHTLGFTKVRFERTGGP